MVKLVAGQYLCRDCYQRLGGQDYKNAMDEVMGVKHGAGYPPPEIRE
jgi:hypothetical protein